MTDPNCGCRTLAQALTHHGVRGVFGVGGKPVTHCGDLLAQRHLGFEWALNEKTAMEAAVGLSAVGERSAVLLKQTGLNVALDPLVNSVYHSIAAGLVVVVGDDVGAISSTCEQDSRALARDIGIAVFEPPTAAWIDPLLAIAFEVSEIGSTPVLFRILPDLHERFSFVRPTATSRQARGRRTIDAAVAHEMTKLGRQQWHRLRTWPLVCAAVESHDLVERSCRPRCSRAVLCVSSTAGGLDAASIGVCRATVAASWPLPSSVEAFVHDHDEVLVLEEPGPFVEREIRGVERRARPWARVKGRLSGHLPPEGPLDEALVADALRALDGAGHSWSHVARKQPGAAQLRQPYESLFEAVARLRREGAFVAADVGSSVKLCYPPFEGADVALCLGSSVGVAGGAARAGAAGVAVIGDYGLLHSGLEALIDVVRNDLHVLVVLLANGVSAQTGGQATAASASPEACARPVSLPELIHASGVRVVDGWETGNTDAEQAYGRLKKLLDERAPAVAIVRQGAGIFGEVTA